MNNTQCTFLGYGYFISNWRVCDFPVKGVIVKDTDSLGTTNRLVSTVNPIGFSILKLEPAPGVSEDQMFGKLTTRPHKVFAKDWPVGLGQDEDGDWPISHCRKYRVAIHDFHNDYLIQAGPEWIPSSLFEELLIKMHNKTIIDLKWR